MKRNAAITLVIALGMLVWKKKSDATSTEKSPEPTESVSSAEQRSGKTSVDPNALAKDSKNQVLVKNAEISSAVDSSANPIESAKNSKVSQAYSKQVNEAKTSFEKGAREVLLKYPATAGGNSQVNCETSNCRLVIDLDPKDAKAAHEITLALGEVLTELNKKYKPMLKDFHSGHSSKMPENTLELYAEFYEDKAEMDAAAQEVSDKKKEIRENITRSGFEEFRAQNPKMEPIAATAAYVFEEAKNQGKILAAQSIRTDCSTVPQTGECQIYLSFPASTQDQAADADTWTYDQLLTESKDGLGVSLKIGAVQNQLRGGVTVIRVAAVKK